MPPKPGKWDQFFEPSPMAAAAERMDENPEGGASEEERRTAEQIFGGIAYLQGLQEFLTYKTDKLLDEMHSGDDIAIGVTKGLRMIARKLDADIEAAKRILHG